MKVNDLVKQRAAAFDKFAALANKPTLTAEERRDYDARHQEVKDLDDQIKRAKAAQEMAGAGARPVGGQERVFASVENDPYVNEGAAQSRGLKSHKGLRAIALAKMFYAGGSTIAGGRALATDLFGEAHPITQAFAAGLNRDGLLAGVGANGGFIIPPDYVNEIIELLRPRTVVRASNPRTMPMPRGTLTMPGQASPATANYGGETSAIASTQQTLDQIIATYKKLTALVPITNDMMRYADPAADAFVRDDLVKVMALREDLAFLTGDGTQGSPRGYLSFANSWAVSQGGTAGVWSSSANSVAAVNGSAGSALSGQNGGNFITSTLSYTLATVAAEVGGLVNKLDSANVPEDRRVWFMHPRTKNYLYEVQNSLGVFVFRAELDQGKFWGYPIKTTTQIPINIWDTTGANKDCSFIFLAEMDETMILDSMSLELAISREGTYVDSTGATVSAFQTDRTLVRAIAEHDFQLRHQGAVAVNQFVRWAPAIS